MKDALAYESVGISEGKVYLINPRGEISLTQNTTYKKTYVIFFFADFNLLYLCY